MSKVWANGLVIVVAVGLSLYLVVRAIARCSDRGLDPAVHGGRRDLSVFRHSIGIFLGT